MQQVILSILEPLPDEYKTSEFWDGFKKARYLEYEQTSSLEEELKIKRWKSYITCCKIHHYISCGEVI